MMFKMTGAFTFLWRAMLGRVKTNKGQNTVEYLLLLTVVVGVVLVVAGLLKGWFPVWIEQIKGLLTGAAAGAANPEI
jgi:hypothetical protein